MESRLTITQHHTWAEEVDGDYVIHSEFVSESHLELEEEDGAADPAANVSAGEIRLPVAEYQVWPDTPGDS